MPFPFFFLLFLPVASQSGRTAVVAAVIAFVLLTTALYLFFFYLFTRLKFAWFDILVNRGEFVAPAWRKYGPQSLSWTVFKVVFGSLITLALSAPIAAYIRHLIPLFRSMTHGQQPTAQLIGAIYAGYGIVALVFAVLSLTHQRPPRRLHPPLPRPGRHRPRRGIPPPLRPHRRRARRVRPLHPPQDRPRNGRLYGRNVRLGGRLFFIATLIVVLVFGGIGFALHLAGVPTGPPHRRRQ
jgi:hypothetical protein